LADLDSRSNAYLSPASGAIQSAGQKKYREIECIVSVIDCIFRPRKRHMPGEFIDSCKSTLIEIMGGLLILVGRDVQPGTPGNCLSIPDPAYPKNS
jgi:hypothetical protein